MYIMLIKTENLQQRLKNYEHKHTFELNILLTNSVIQIISPYIFLKKGCNTFNR